MGQSPLCLPVVVCGRPQGAAPTTGCGIMAICTYLRLSYCQSEMLAVFLPMKILVAVDGAGCG